MRRLGTTPRVVLVGSFGHGNIGDDILMHRQMELVTAACPKARLNVLALGTVTHTIDLRLQPEAVRLKQPLSAVSILLRRVLPADVLILGPGGLVNHHFPAVLAAQCALVAACRVMGIRVGLIGVGVGPLDTPRSRRMASLIARSAHVISVRDEGSLRALPPAVRHRARSGTDVAWSIRAPVEPGSRRGLVICLRPWQHWPADAAVDRAVALAQRFAVEHPGEPVSLLPMDRGQDPKALSALQSRLEGRMEVRLCEVPPLDALPDWIAQHRAVVSMRYHAGLLGALAGCRVSLLAYDSKVRSLAEQLDVPWWAPDIEADAKLLLPSHDALERARRLSGVHAEAVADLLSDGYGP